MTRNIQHRRLANVRSGLPNLRALRKALDLTQAELAQRADVTQATISDLESGEQQMAQFATLRRLAKALRVSVGELFEKPKVGG